MIQMVLSAARARVFTLYWLPALAMVVGLAGTPRDALAAGPEFSEIAPSLVEAEPDSVFSVVPPRQEGDISRDREDAETAARTADEWIVMAKSRGARAAAQVDVKKSEVENIKARIKAAKEAKNEAEQKDLERQQKELELAQKRLERIRDMRGAEVDYAQAAKATAQARVQLFAAERGLLDARRQMEEAGSNASSAEQLEKFLSRKVEVGKAETRVLDAIKELAGKREEVAKKAKELADRRTAIQEIDLEMAARRK